MRFELLGLMLVLLTVPAAADARDDRHALVMLRVLAYDKQLAQRVGEEVRFVVVVPDEEKRTEEQRWRDAFAKATKLKVDGRPVVLVVHRFASASVLRKFLADQHAAALLLGDGLSKKIDVAAVAKMTRANKVLSIATRESAVADGAALAIVSGESRDEIVLNPEAAEAEGVKFDAGLLQLARKVGR